MQGSTAKEYGLKTFCGCGALVCNGKDGRSCKDKNGHLENHAKDLAEFMKVNENNREALVNADDRLNILLNIDAAGRMIASGISGPKLSGKLSGLDPLQSSVARYAGAYNFKSYWKDIIKNMKSLSDENILNKVSGLFDKRNPDLKINGVKAGYLEYVDSFQEQHRNYGLDEYKKLPKYLPNNTAQVARTYKKYLA